MEARFTSMPGLVQGLALSGHAWRQHGAQSVRGDGEREKTREKTREKERESEMEREYARMQERGRDTRTDLSLARAPNGNLDSNSQMSDRPNLLHKMSMENSIYDTLTDCSLANVPGAKHTAYQVELIQNQPHTHFL